MGVIMALFSNKNKMKAKSGGISDVIRCDQESYLIWKWHPSGALPGENKRENSIRWGSSLRVKDGEVAVFVYNQENGVYQDFIPGPFDECLQTKNFPILSSLLGLFYEGDTPFQAEVYFINIAKIQQIKFSVPYFDIFDNRFTEIGVPVSSWGTITYSIKDYKEFVKLHRLRDFDSDEFATQIRDAVKRYVKNAIANAPSNYDIPVVQIETKISQLTSIIEKDLKNRLSRDFGVNVSGIDIEVINVDKSSTGYKELMKLTKERVMKYTMAEDTIRIRDMDEKQRIESHHYKEALRVQREEGKYAQHMGTRTANFGAYQVEKQAEVGVAGAYALGELGAKGAGNVTINGGDGGLGFNMAGMMASMAVGSAVGQNIAGAMNNMMGSINQPTVPGSVPPPIPNIAYYVATNGQATGPFDVSILRQMASVGQFTAESLVWKQGMTNWISANSVEELKSLFIPPVSPKV